MHENQPPSYICQGTHKPTKKSQIIEKYFSCIRPYDIFLILIIVLLTWSSKHTLSSNCELICHYIQVSSIKVCVVSNKQ